MTNRNRIALVLLALPAVACSPFAVSPPVRTVPIETAETIGAEHTGLSAAAGAHLAGVYDVGVRVRHGLVDDVEIQLEGTYAYYDTLEDRPASEHAGSGRIGVKHRVWEHLALTGGIGAGVGPWGLFVGPDLGAVLAYENPYFVPFLALRTQLSVPAIAESETIVDSNGVTTVLTPPVTFYFQPSIGGRIPLYAEGAEGPRVDLLFAISYTHLVMLDSPRGDLGSFGGNTGIELRL